MSRTLRVVGIVAGIAYLGLLGVLLTGQLRSPTSLAEVDAARVQMRSAALEAGAACDRLAQGHSTVAFTIAAGDQLSQQTARELSSLSGRDIESAAKPERVRVYASGRRLLEALDAMQSPDVAAHARALETRFLAIAQELSR